MEEKPVIFVIDDDQTMLRLIAAVLESEGLTVQTFPDAEAFLNAFTPESHGCLLLDEEMPGLSGLELQQELLTRVIRLPVIFLSATTDVPTAVAAMKHGALDLLQKPFEPKALITAVRRALTKDAQNSTDKKQHQDLAKLRERLTPREMEVMHLVVAGNSNKQITAALTLSPKTVEIHRGRVMHKMKAQSVAELVHKSIEFERLDQSK
jgi:two-component system, LuxR family, response regulator FixJ